ncbi:hypothetical protein SK128_001674 [Halocaridina rubra]|uniref:Wolframin n=1 Tax=Halocaridina rubra TaxID=373956 RepID=A0AAN8WS32_HALRR
MSATLPSDPTIPVNSQRKTSRRQWSVQGGPRGLLQRMRSQLAEDGCPESQLVMGRTLLQQLDSNQETADEDARLAVFWLTQASLQGNKEATELLENCLNNNIGICDHNYRDIRECLEMDLQEKLARGAAHLLFSRLSDGNDFISSSSLSNKVHNLVKGVEEEDKLSDDHQQEKSEDCNNLEEKYGGERFAEDHLISASVFYCQGHVPPLHRYITPAPSSAESHLVNTFMLPVRLIVEIYSSCVNFLGVNLTNFFLRLFSLANPVSSFVMVLILSYLILLMGTGQTSTVLPGIVSCISLFVMILSTAHMLLLRRHFDAFHTWSVVFSYYCPELDVDKIENKFKTRCWKPYAALIIAIFFYLGSVPLTSSKFIIYYLPALYLCSALTLFLVPERLNLWQFVSLAVHLSAVTPSVYNTINHWVLPFVKETGLELAFTLHQIHLWENVKLNLGIASMFHMIWCLCCGIVLLKYGIVFFMPHLVSLMWCHLSVLATQMVTDGDNLLTPIATWCVLVILPFATPLVLTVAPGLIFASLCLKLGYDLYIATLILVTGIALTWMLRQFWPSFTIVYKVVLMGVILISVLQPNLMLKLPTQKTSRLMWESYKNTCWPTKNTNAASVHRCLPLQGTLVNWQGTVTQVEIVNVQNIPQSILGVLPEFVENPLKCYIGIKSRPCHSNKLSLDEREHCHVLQNALGANACTLENWNEYTFEINIAMTSSSWKFGSGTSLIKIIADDVFREFALGLHLSDEVDFIGALDKNIGSQNPSLILSSIKCINCKSKLSSLSKHTLQFQRDLWVAPTFIFNFLMGPVLTI